MTITQKEKDLAQSMKIGIQFYLNITHGTRLVTGALCTAALMIGAEMYYLKQKDSDSENCGINDLKIRIPTPRIPDLDKMTDNRRRFIKMVCSETNGVTIKQLADEFGSKQNVNQYVCYFEENNFIERIHEGRFVRIKATELGRMAANWLI